MTATDTSDIVGADDSARPLSMGDLADAKTAAIEYKALGLSGPVVYVMGWDTSLRVRNGALEIKAGYHPERTLATFARSDKALEAIVMAGHGLITTEAFAWCAEAHVRLIVTTISGEPLAISASDITNDASLKRSQALATMNGSAVEITRYLLKRRLSDQVRIARLLERDDIADKIAGVADWLDRLDIPRELMLVEGEAAGYYWRAWSKVEISFASKDDPRVPMHWRSFGVRASALSTNSANRHATNAPNALLNYSYRLAESAATLVCYGIGLDPSLGFAHADKASRRSAALDLIEACRGVVEERILALVQSHTFAKRDFSEDGQGIVRLAGSIRAELCKMLWQPLMNCLAPVGSHIASLVAPDRYISPIRPARAHINMIAQRCRVCGAKISRANGVFCSDDCRRSRWKGATASHATRSAKAAKRAAGLARSGTDEATVERAVEALRRRYRPSELARAVPMGEAMAGAVLAGRRRPGTVLALRLVALAGEEA